MAAASSKDGGRTFGFISRNTPFRSARHGVMESTSSQPQYYVQAGDGYQQMPPEQPRLNLDPWLETTYYKEALDSFNIYDPTFWMPTIRFSVSGIMFWPWLILTLAAFGQAVYFLQLNPDHGIEMPLDAHIVMGGALSFLVVMRTDASMERWWEARCSWQTIINCCLSIGAQTAPALPTTDTTELLLMQLMAFGICLKAWLRDTTVQREELGPRMDWNYVRQLNAAHNPPITALKAMSTTVRMNLPENLGSAIYDETSEQIRMMNHAVGACIKIKRTPMTFGYVTTLRSFLILWLVTLSVPLIGEFGWMAVPVSSLITFLFLNVEQMAVEIEQPFGDDANDLPIESYLMDLEKTLLEMTPGWVPDLGDAEGESASGTGSGSQLVRYDSTSDALAHRIAALESAWQAEHQAQAQTINQLSAELTRARGGTSDVTAAAAVSSGTPGTVPNGGSVDWNKISPMWQQSQVASRPR